MSDIDYPSLIEPVARHFWGEPNKGLTTKIGARFGSQGSKTIVFATGEWFDHEQQRGGGVTKLVIAEVEHVSTEAEAHRWLEDNGFIAKEDAPARQPRQVTQEPQDDPPPFEPDPPKQADGKKVMVEAYDYVNRDGERLYQVVRFQFKLPDGRWQLGKNGTPKKTFAQRRKDERGEVVWNLDGIGHTIYRHNLVEAAIAEGKTIYMPEGEKDVHTLEGWGLVATTNSGGAANWKPHLAEHFSGADVVILGDDDEPGRKRVDEIARSLRQIAARVRAIYNWGGPKDVTDWRDAGGDASKLDEIVKRTPEWRPPPPRSKFGAQTSAAIAAKPVVYDWLIKNLIERNGVLIIAGESMAGKSFLVMDMGMKVARGVDYAERRVRQGAVIHMAVEDGKGTELRFKGYLKAHNISPDIGLPYVVMDPYANGGMGFSLMSDEQVDKFIAECLEWKEFYGSLEFIIIDTLSMATEGLDENSSGEASKVLGRVNRIRERTGATVCLVHHMNAGGTKVRGSTALVANVPNVIEVRPLMTMPTNRKEEPRAILDSNGRPIRKAKLAKNKNGVANKAWNFVLEEIQLNDLDQDGEPYSTMFCARPARNSSSSGSEDATKLIGDQKLVFDALVLAQTDQGIDRPDGTSAPPAIGRCVKQSDFVAAVRRVINFTAGEEEVEARNKELQAFLKRTTTALINAGYMGRDNDNRIVWTTGKSDRPRPRREPEAEPPPPLPASVLAELNDIGVPF